MSRKITVLGLTGSIGMGKSTVARQLEQLGAKVCNADAIVHRLLASDGAAVDVVGQAFPQTVKNGEIDRHALGDIVFYDKGKMAELEEMLHPLVVAEENAFIAREEKNGHKVAVLEIPLLYETNAENRCDKVLIVTAPAFIQKYRVLKRPGMTLEKFRNILTLQMPDEEKRRRADFVVQTGLGRAYSYYQVKQVLEKLHAARNHS
jgi:dephospho-CoA kinase